MTPPCQDIATLEANISFNPVLTVTIKEAKRISGLSHVTIYKQIKLGKLRIVKVGRRTLVTYASLRGLLDVA